MCSLDSPAARSAETLDAPPTHDPARGTPPRRAPSVRRTSHLDVGPAHPDGWLIDQPVPVSLHGAARDLATTETDAADLASAQLALDLDADGHVTHARLDREDTPQLVGTAVRHGWHTLVRGLVDDLTSPRGLLLRDVPVVATTLAGYGAMRARQQAGVTHATELAPRHVSRLENRCAGLRRTGAWSAAVRHGRPMPLADPPPAPALETGDIRSWHVLLPLPTGWVRRRRRLDLCDVDGEVVVDAMFRDSFAQRDGTEVVLHEYSLGAWFDATTLQLREIVATPRALPFPDCPLAADQVDRLLGTPLPEIADATTRHLDGTAGCTHLNDLLTCLADLTALLPRLS